MVQRVQRVFDLLAPVKLVVVYLSVIEGGMQVGVLAQANQLVLLNFEFVLVISHKHAIDRQKAH